MIQIPDERPYVQRLHDALEEACARLLKAGDQPSVGGVPASVIVTISIEELLAKTGLAETADGTQLTAEQLLRIADEAEIWPTIDDGQGFGARSAWLYVTLLSIGYMISRGLAKAGSRERNDA
jgi:hypothetical protein